MNSHWSKLFVVATTLLLWIPQQYLAQNTTKSTTTTTTMATTTTTTPKPCKDGFYGNDCQKECHCQNEAACDRKKGECPGGKCQQWYVHSPKSKRCDELISSTAQFDVTLTIGDTSVEARLQHWIRPYLAKYYTYELVVTERNHTKEVLKVQSDIKRRKISNLEKHTVYSLKVTLIRHQNGINDRLANTTQHLSFKTLCGPPSAPQLAHKMWPERSVYLYWKLQPRLEDCETVPVKSTTLRIAAHRRANESSSPPSQEPVNGSNHTVLTHLSVGTYDFTLHVQYNQYPTVYSSNTATVIIREETLAEAASQSGSNAAWTAIVVILSLALIGCIVFIAFNFLRKTVWWSENIGKRGYFLGKGSDVESGDRDDGAGGAASSLFLNNRQQSVQPADSGNYADLTDHDGKENDGVYTALEPAAGESGVPNTANGNQRKKTGNNNNKSGNVGDNVYENMEVANQPKNKTAQNKGRNNKRSKKNKVPNSPSKPPIATKPRI